MSIDHLRAEPLSGFVERDGILSRGVSLCDEAKIRQRVKCPVPSPTERTDSTNTESDRRSRCAPRICALHFLVALPLDRPGGLRSRESDSRVAMRGVFDGAAQLQVQ